MRKTIFTTGEYYHLYNRGVDKRNIFMDKADLGRFFESMEQFNTLEPIGSLRDPYLRDRVTGTTGTKLVEFVCYCLNPNHYHFLVRQSVDKGIEKFMHKLSLGYTRYFNIKHQRTGSLFQSKFKDAHQSSNKQLLHTSVYVNRNNELGNEIPYLSKSSWREYMDEKMAGFCSKNVIVEQFSQLNGYLDFAENTLKDIKYRKSLQ